MKIKLINLTIAVVCGLPFAGFGQGTYLSDPNDSNNHALVVAPGGQIGIGTSDPGGLLNVAGRNPVILISQDPAAAGGGTLKITAAGDLTNKAKIELQSIILETTSGGGIGNYFKVSDRYSGDMAYFGGDGNVGIGTTSPETKLHIASSGPTETRVESVDERAILSLESTFGSIRRGWSLENGLEGVAGLFGIYDRTVAQSRLAIDTSGNVGIGTTTPQAKLDVAGKVNCTVLELTSDRAQKSGFAQVDSRAILDQVARLPITTWQYTNEPAVRHIGPMAQDFKAAFSVGSDDKHIATVDADGVALAAIQALCESLNQKDREIGTLRQELAKQHNEVTARITALEQRLALSASTLGNHDASLVASASHNDSSFPSQNVNQENQ